MKHQPRHISVAILCGAVSAAASTAFAADPFYMGGDVSLLPFIESRGGVFRDGGQARPMEQIAVNHGDNLFRLRLFVNPDPVYEHTSGAIQDLNYTIALAQRLKATGAKILLDFHYSDTWADPGHQTKPAAWVGQDFPTLNSTLRSYTASALTSFKNAGVMPEMVQVGNEITNGMLWSDGSILYSGTTAEQNASWGRLGSLLNSAIAGVRDVDATTPGQHTQVAIHIDGGDVQGRAQYYFSRIASLGGVSDYDVAGLSFYPANTSALTNLQGNMNYLATSTSKKVMVLETNYPWKGAATGAQWASTPSGQQQMLTTVRDAVHNLPNGRGQGVVWWYPEAIQVPNTFIFKGGAIALFDQNGNALPALSSFSLSPPTWNVDADGTWYNAGNWAGGVPMFAGDVANFGSVITAPRTVTLNAPQSAATINFDNANRYTIAGTSTLTLDATSGSVAVNVISGSHTIAAPVVLNDDLAINVAPVGSTLTFSGDVGAAGRAITKTGGGAAQLLNLRAMTLSVNAGTIVIATNGSSSGASKVGTLALAGGATPTASLDLNDNDLIVSNSSITTIAGAIASARHGGAWDQPGITSPAARAQASHATMLGVMSGAEYLSVNGASFDNFSVAPADTLVKYTWYGDSDFNGRVNFDDYVRTDSGFNNHLSGWLNGDFDLNGVINFDDYVLIDLAFNTQDGTLGRALAFLDGSDRLVEGMNDPALRRVQLDFDHFGADYAQHFLAAVPEPSLTITILLPALLARRSRCRKFEEAIRKSPETPSAAR